MLAPLYFLNRSELWETVKPYTINYIPKEKFPLNNLQRSSHNVPVHSMRPLVPTLSLDTHGFEVHQLSSGMAYADFMDRKNIESVYLNEIERHLQVKFGAKSVRALDYQVRVQDPDFPYFKGKPHPTPQPSISTHVDVTPQGAISIIRSIYGDDSEDILGGRYQILTIWRALRSPIEDWPLAICDASTVSPRDLVDADVIYPNYVAENRLVHYSEKQKWYWLPDQKIDEVLVFKAMDSAYENQDCCLLSNSPF
ncbi:hypothetical protein PG984_002664 [Apiospora sp. TS-2023a]